MRGVSAAAGRCSRSTGDGAAWTLSADLSRCWEVQGQGVRRFGVWCRPSARCAGFLLGPPWQRDAVSSSVGTDPVVWVPPQDPVIPQGPSGRTHTFLGGHTHSVHSRWPHRASRPDVGSQSQELAARRTLYALRCRARLHGASEVRIVSGRVLGVWKERRARDTCPRQGHTHVLGVFHTSTFRFWGRPPLCPWADPSLTPVAEVGAPAVGREAGGLPALFLVRSRPGNAQTSTSL